MRSARHRRLARSPLVALSLFASILMIGCVSGQESPPPEAPTPTPQRAIASLPTASPAVETPAPTPAPSLTGAPVPARWLPSGRMISPHAFHTATLLGDGTVLVAGGLLNDRLDGQVLAAAERYDPTRGTWTATVPMRQARWGHTATLLPDGTILVAGSYSNGGDPLASAELYDPRAGRWTAGASMTTGRGGHTATLLLDGRVLVVGGGAEDTNGEGGPRSATAELYDPASGQWSRTGSMVEARTGFSTTLLADGRVLVAGGDGGFTAAELYDPGSGRWTATGSMSNGRFGHTGTRLGDGSVLVTGGCACSEPGAITSAERYDPVSGRWTATGSMSTGRIAHQATLLANGLVLVVDGGPADAEPSSETYDPNDGRWMVSARPLRSRQGYSATLLSDGTVLVAGDYDDGSRALTELYIPAGH